MSAHSSNSTSWRAHDDASTSFPQALNAIALDNARFTSDRSIIDCLQIVGLCPVDLTTNADAIRYCQEQQSQIINNRQRRWKLSRYCLRNRQLRWRRARAGDRSGDDSGTVGRRGGDNRDVDSIQYESVTKRYSNDATRSGREIDRLNGRDVTHDVPPSFMVYLSSNTPRPSAANFSELSRTISRRSAPDHRADDSPTISRPSVIETVGKPQKCWVLSVSAIIQGLASGLWSGDRGADRRSNVGETIGATVGGRLGSIRVERRNIPRTNGLGDNGRDNGR